MWDGLQSCGLRAGLGETNLDPELRLVRYYAILLLCVVIVEYAVVMVATRMGTIFRGRKKDFL
jgi:hypothetical protein